MSKSFKRIIAVFAVVTMLAALFCGCKKETAKGSKTISITAVFADGSEKSYEIATDAEYLYDALDEQGLIEGDEGAYGFYVTGFDGVVADDGNQEWWGYTYGDGSYVNTGVSETPIFDGDEFIFTLNIGY